MIRSQYGMQYMCMSTLQSNPQYYGYSMITS